MSFRIYDNNCALISSYSSQLTGYNASNLVSSTRSSSWRPIPSFLVSVNHEGYYDQYTHGQIDYNDGSGFNPPTTLAFVASGTYTGATLATAVKNGLNARESNNWNVTYSSTTGLFTFTCTTSRTLRFYKSGSLYTNFSLSKALGMVIEDGLPPFYTEKTGTSFTSDYPVFHSAEYIVFDTIAPVTVNSLILESKIGELLKFTSSSYIYLMADNINSFTPGFKTNAEPPFVQRITYDQKLTNILPTDIYRFWCLLMIDPYNSIFANNIDISKIYLGDYTTIQARNVSNGISPRYKDTSEKIYSENGTLYFYDRPKTFDIGKVSLQFINNTSMETLLDIYSRYGETTPFFISIDPEEEISGNNVYTRYVYFDSEPIFNHVIYHYYNCVLSFRECI